MKYAIILKRNGEYVKRVFTSPSGIHYTSNVTSAFSTNSLARAEAHLAKARSYTREELVIITVAEGGGK